MTITEMMLAVPKPPPSLKMIMEDAKGALRKENIMPIPGKQFDKSIDTLSEDLLRFLNSNADEAFDIEELAEAVGGKQLEVWAILDYLKRQKQVSGKCIKGQGYYCVVK